MSKETYNQLRREWQEKLRHLELTLAELEREVSFHLDDLDAALALKAKVADLYPRLEKKQRGILLQILAKQIIVDPLRGTFHKSNFPLLFPSPTNDELKLICTSGPPGVSKLLFLSRISIAYDRV